MSTSGSRCVSSRQIAPGRAAGAIDPVVLVVGSAEQYGRHDAAAMPLTEDVECRPRTVYAASKQAQEICALQAFRADGVRVVCTRSFNHSGPGQGKSFLIPALVQRALAAGAAGETRIAIGNTDTVRDFLHVSDAVRAYRLLAERWPPGGGLQRVQRRGRDGRRCRG